MRRFIVPILLLLCAAPAFAALTDSAVHAPPTSGDYGYNSFVPGSAGFPALGGTYVDPVFGETVRRLTDVGNSQLDDEMYAHHYANADGTLAFLDPHQFAPMSVIDTATGAVRYSGRPTDGGFDAMWDPVDPDLYYVKSGANLVAHRLSTNANTTLHTFPSSLASNGGSLDWVDRTATYFSVTYGGAVHVWKRGDAAAYAGNVPLPGSGGWSAITPDGNYVVTSSSAHHSYAIDHNAKSVAATGPNFWTRCGDHGVLVSASDGKNYFVTFDCNSNPPDGASTFAVDIVTGSAKKLVQGTYLKTGDGHFCAPGKSPNQDWAFADYEEFSSGFNSGVSGWVPYQSEIVAMNVVTGELRRLAHHRSRNLNGNYWYQPRISCSWGGELVMWDSNMNANRTSGYADRYAIRFNSGGQPPAPDTDNDGVPDATDQCPTQAGPASNNGCPLPPPPDTDGDGIADATDQCPSQAGPASNNGCPLPPPPPDADEDGVPDASDACPDEAGPASNGGCPLPADADGDGVPDELDDCPNDAGPADNAGCPVEPPPPPPPDDPPAAPIGVTVEERNGKKICVLSWTANTEPDLRAYRIYHTLTPDFWPATWLKQTRKHSIACKALGIARDGRTHYFRVTAIDNGKHESPPSAVVSVTVVKPGK